jgi:hypothetical protein
MKYPFSCIPHANYRSSCWICFSFFLSLFLPYFYFFPFFLSFFLLTLPSLFSFLWLEPRGLYHLSYAHPFVFEIGSHKLCLGWPRTNEPPTSTSSVAGIISVYHYAQLNLLLKYIPNLVLSHTSTSVTILQAIVTSPRD